LAVSPVKSTDNALPPAIRCIGVSKTFGSTRANEDVSFTVERGSIHGLVGENGAGKSTCVKMLYGLYRPDVGNIEINGRKAIFSSSTDAIAAGVGMVHQHFMLSPTHSVLDNIVLGAEPLSGWSRFLPAAFRTIDRVGARHAITAAGKAYGLEVPLDAKVETLAVGVQQRIEILKLLYRKAQILILDEPTAVLTPAETAVLFGNLRRLKAEGHTIVIITHKLDEVLALTDQVTVFRGGRVVGHVATRETSAEELAGMMVGRSVKLSLEVVSGRLAQDSSPILSVEHLTVVPRKVSTGDNTTAKPVLRDVSLAVRGGEIVGVAGVEGNGQRDLFDSILQVDRHLWQTTGDIQISGEDGTSGGRGRMTTARLRQTSLGVIPFDRHREGLLLEASARENVILGYQALRDNHSKVSVGWFPVLGSRVTRERAAKVVQEFDVRPGDPELRSGALSGGNQQKLIFGRELVRDPRLILAANPIRGVDVGAIEFIHSRLVAARDRGAAILLFSSDLDEILTLSDRVLVMYDGAVVGEFTRKTADRARIGLLMGGGVVARSGGQ